MKLSAKLLIFFSLFLLPQTLWSQASVNVDPFDPVYRDIDKLVGHGLVDKIIVGQRPYSRRAIADITAQGMRKLAKLETQLNDPKMSQEKKNRLVGRIGYLKKILKRMEREYHEELIQLGQIKGESQWYSLHPLDEINAGIIISNSLPRTIQGNNLGEIDAVINPLLQYRQGRNLVDGSNLSLETTHWFRATDYFAAFARPRFQIAIGREGQPDNNNAYILNAYGKVFFHNFEMEFGRDNLFYGQGYNAGLLLSNNPRGLDMVKLSNDIPSFLPWVFKYMGAQKLSFFYANLGPEQFYPYSYLLGFKWSLLPFSFLEIGVGTTSISGGEGSPPSSFAKRAADLFPFIFVDLGAESNHFSGVDFRFRIPTARGAQVYMEMIFDDINSNLSTMFKQDTGYIGGIFLPRLNYLGTLDLRLEFHKTGVRYYRHGQFFSGYTENQFILGDNLGPNAYGAYLVLNWDVDEKNLLTFNGAFENRNNDNYISILKPDGGIDHFEKIESFPNEKRIRIVSGWLHRIEGYPMLLQVQFGFERVQNFNFVGGSDRNNFLGQVGIQIKLDKETKFPHTIQ